MSWTAPAQLRAQVQRLWDRGELLADGLRGPSRFPLRLALKVPTSAETADRFDEVRTWSAQLRGLRHVRVELRRFRHRLLGDNALPAEVWLDRREDALAWIGCRDAAARFDTLVETTRIRQPKLIDWLARRPLKGLALAGDWSRLLDVAEWLLAHPRPGLYLRQVDLPGIDSKFIEQHRGVLAELFDHVLPLEQIEAGARGGAGFHRRYGFLDKPLRIRFRVLDPAIKLLPGVRGGDLSLDAASFRALHCPVRRVFITENEVNFLAFPSHLDALVLFGAGYGFDALDGATWLSGCELHYWGDIDTHGFAILDQLRARFDHVRSLLMDRTTLLAHREAWCREPVPVNRDLPRLDAAERALYDELRGQRLGEHVRLEQERIGYGRLCAALDGLS